MIETIQTLAALIVLALALVPVLVQALEDQDTRSRARRAAIRNRQEPR